MFIARAENELETTDQKTEACSAAFLNCVLLHRAPSRDCPAILCTRCFAAIRAQPPLGCASASNKKYFSTLSVGVTTSLRFQSISPVSNQYLSNLSLESGSDGNRGGRRGGNSIERDHKVKKKGWRVECREERERAKETEEHPVTPSDGCRKGRKRMMIEDKNRAGSDIKGERHGDMKEECT